MPTVSMALLQGYLLRHKGCPVSAVKNVSQLGSGEYAYSPIPSTASLKKTLPVAASAAGAVASAAPVGVGSGLNKAVRPRPVKRMTAEEVDKMCFNPQEGWDRDIINLTK